MAPAAIIEALATEVHAAGGSLVLWGIAWARVLPTVLLVPAFGLGVVPPFLRVAIGFALAVSFAPALHATALATSAPWPVLLAGALGRGVPVAVAASVSLLAAMVAGGVADTAAGLSRARAASTPFGAGSSPLATLMALAAAVVFLDTGSAAAVVTRLSASGPDSAEPLARAAFDLAAGVGLGAAIGAPILVVAVVLDLATLVAARELPALRVPSTLAPLRTLVVLVATAALLDRMVEAVLVQGTRP